MASDSDLQRIGQTVGAKIRAARLAKKYTQSQLAQPDFSVSYVSAIERGQIHPSLRALEIFAQRLGLSSSDLLTKQAMLELQGPSEKDSAVTNNEVKALQLIEAQLYMHQGNNNQAVILLRNLPFDASNSEQQIQQRFLLGWAYYLSGYLEESEAVLAEALHLVQDHDDFWMKHILNVLGMVHASMHNHTQAFEYQLQMLDRMKTEQQPHDVFLDAQIYNTSGLHYLSLNKIDEASEMFQHALSLTKEGFLQDQLSSMYWDISRYLVATQHYAMAMLNAHKSLELLFQENNDALRSEIYHYLGQAMLRQDQQKSVGELEMLLQEPALQSDALALASVTATTALALYRAGEIKKAHTYAQRACELASPYGNSIVTASIFITMGRIAYAQKDYNQGDAHFASGLVILERLDRRDELSDQSAIYAQLLEERNLPNEALRFYKKAYENSRERG